MTHEQFLDLFGNVNISDINKIRKYYDNKTDFIIQNIKERKRQYEKENEVEPDCTRQAIIIELENILEDIGENE